MADTRAVIQKFIDHVNAGRFAEAFSLLNEDGRYIVIGKTGASGVYNGRKELFEKLLPALATFKVPPALKFGDVIVEGNKGAFRASGKGVGPTGDYDQPYYMWYVRVEGDGFAEMIEHLDTVQIETAVFGKKLVDA